MTPLVMALIIALCFWMALCAICGFRRRVMLFFGLLLTGLTINQIWMMVGLNAKLLEPPLPMPINTSAAVSLSFLEPPPS